MHIQEAPILQITRFYTGLYTFRNPLVVPIWQAGRRIIELYDALSDGSNMEVTNTLTLKRRPGYIAFNSNVVTGTPLAFYSFKPSSFPGNVYPIVDTTTAVQYIQTGPASPSTLISKTTPSQTNFCGIGPYLYMGNPNFSQKWDGPLGAQGVTNWGIAIGSVSAAIGPNGVTTGANALGGTWANPTRITAFDGSFSTVNVTGSTGTTISSPGYLEGTGCGFALPGTDVVTGIQVDVFGFVTTSVTPSRPSAQSGNYATPLNAYDNNFSTDAVGSDSIFLSNPKTETWSGFAAGPPSPTSVTLNINSQVIGNATSGGRATLSYSLNNGSSFTTIYDTTSPLSQHTDAISLSVSQDITQIQVKATATASAVGTGAVSSLIFEIWVDATLAPISGNESLTVNLLKAGTVTGNSRSQSLPSSSGMVSFGGQNDLWGSTWTYNDVNQTTFGAAMVANVINLASTLTFNIDFVQVTVYALGGPAVTLVGGSLTAQNGFQYEFCYGNSVSGHVSSPTPPSVNIVPSGQGVQISLTASSDPQVNQIRVFRTTDGGGQPFFELPTSPYPNTTQNVVDNAPDNTLQIANICPLPHFNDPPPQGLVDPVWFSGRLWGHVGNLLYFSSGPDITMGNGPEAWFPIYVFSLPTTIIRKFPLPNGMLVVTTDDIFVVRGLDTPSFTVNEFLRDLGMRNWNAGDTDSSNVYIYTTDRQMLQINANGVTSISSNISDVIANVDPSVAYVSIFRYTARNTLLFLGDGSTNLYPYNLQLNAWCPVQTPTGGVQAIGAIETQLGVYQFLRGRASANQTITQRQLNTYTDEGTTYACSATFGPIPVADMLALSQVRDLAVATAASGSTLSIGVIANEVSGTFQGLSVSSTEPPELSATPSSSFTANRYTFKQTILPELMNFVYMQFTWPSASTADELYGWSLGGTQTTGGSTLGPAGQLPQLQGR
jgi:hypothetical protein